MKRQPDKEKIRQHYVPQFYLKYFTTAGGIFGLKVPSGKEFGPAPVKSVAYEKFFYDLPQDLEQRFENTLGNLEARFAHSFRVLNASRDLNALMDVHVGALADFVGIQYWRTPKSRDVLSVLMSHASRSYVVDESTEESRAFYNNGFYLKF